MKTLNSAFFGFVLLACMSIMTRPAAASIFVQDIVPTGIQTWTGPLGDDFTVGPVDIVVSKLGVYDGNPPGLGRNITAYIYDLGGAVVIPATLFTNLNSIPDVDYPDIPYRWITLATPVTLFAGETYSAVAENYGPGELNPNTNLSTPAITFSSDGLSIGGGRYGSQTSQGVYPTTTGPWHFGVANFEYTVASDPKFVPEPATFVIWSLLGALAITVGWWRRRAA